MNILIIRFSAFGDVAMTVPVIHSIATQYPQHSFTVLSRSFMQPLFAQVPPNVSFHGVDLKKDYNGFWGLIRLFTELKNTQHFDAVADLHNVLRTKILRSAFFLTGTKVAYIDKGKAGKKKLIRPKNKVMEMQPSSFSHYCDVFKALGLPVELNFSSIFNNSKGDYTRISEAVGTRNPNEKWIGIAPFAAHKGKIYPIEKTEQVIAALHAHGGMRIFLFGAGKHELSIMNELAGKYSSISLPQGLKMETELILMSYLDVMISMDSANMHLASLVNLPVISIWGATHPFCGFMGYGQKIENAVQINELSCRPCSVFGNKPCFRGDYACLYNIDPQTIVKHILNVVS